VIASLFADMALLLLNLVVLGQTAQIIRSFFQESNSMEAQYWPAEHAPVILPIADCRLSIVDR
jgi:hypothetical protein